MIVELIILSDKFLIIVCIEVLLHLLHLRDLGLVAGHLLPQLFHHLVLVLKLLLHLDQLFLKGVRRFKVVVVEELGEG